MIANDRGYSVIAPVSFVLLRYRRTPRVNVGVIEIGHMADSNLISACN